METPTVEIQKAKTIEEMAIHMGYIAKAVEGIVVTEKDHHGDNQKIQKEIIEKIESMKDTYPTRNEFQDHETRIRSLKTFQDNLSGKIWAISGTVGFAATVLGIIISHYWK